MGFYSTNFSLFYLLLDDNRESAETFDVIVNVIQNSDVLQNDTEEFMKRPAELLLPLYDLSHEELYMYLWNVKYRNELFLPEKWCVLYFKNSSNTCFNCSTKPPSLYHSRVFHAEHFDDMAKIAFDRTNYCVLCRRAIYSVVDVD